MMKINKRDIGFVVLVFVLFLVVLVMSDEIETGGGDFVDFYDWGDADLLQVTDDQGKVIGNKYTFKDGGSISIDYIGKDGGVVKSVTYSGLQSVDGEKPAMLFNENGKLISAKFKTSKGGEFILGNEEIFLPKDSEVRFEKDQAGITIPNGYHIQKPESFDGNPGETVFTFTNKEDNKYEYRFEGSKNVFQGDEIKLHNGRFFIDNKGQAQIGSVLIISDENVRTYLDFNGKINNEYDGAYISVNEKDGVFVTGSNINERGPKVSFAKDNPFGLKFGSKGHFAVQSLGNVEGAYFKVSRGNSQKYVPEFEWQNQFVVDNDGGSVYYNSKTDNLYLRPNENIIAGFDVPKNSEVVVMGGFGYKTKDGKAVKFSDDGNYLGFADHGGIALGSTPDYIVTNNFWNPKGDDPAFSRGFSNMWAYYNLKTAEDFTRITGIKIRDDYNRANTRDLEFLLDVVAQVPAESQREIKIIELGADLRSVGDKLRLGRGIAAMAHSDGLIQVSSHSLDANTLRHEITHLRDFRLNAYGRSAFASKWSSIGGNNAPYLTDHGAGNRREKISSFVEQVYKSQDYWNGYLHGGYGKTVKARLALLRQTGYITEAESARIFGGAGLKFDKESLNKYIREAGG